MATPKQGATASFRSKTLAVLSNQNDKLDKNQSSFGRIPKASKSLKVGGEKNYGADDGVPAAANPVATDLVRPSLARESEEDYLYFDYDPYGYGIEGEEPTMEPGTVYLH